MCIKTFISRINFLARSLERKKRRKENRRKWMCSVVEMENSIASRTKLGVTSDKYTDYDIIVSLTSYGKRIEDVHYTIESIMQQSMLPNRILLFLAQEEEHKKLPVPLQQLKQQGLEVYYVEDLLSYKKLIPALQLCPNDAIITVDDDIIYFPHMLEGLVSAHLQNPNVVCANRCCLLQIDDKGNCLPYKSWPKCDSKEYCGANVFPTGVGGVLYPPNTFDADVFDKDVFMNICRTADDIWFKLMALKNGVLTKKVQTKSSIGQEYLDNPFVKENGLEKKNVHGKHLNDIQLSAVIEHYSLYDIKRIHNT